MINEQSQWELNKRIEYDKKKNLMATIADIWNTPTTRKAGDTNRMSQQYTEGGQQVQLPNNEDLNSSLKTSLVNSIMSDAAKVKPQVEVKNE